MKSKMVETIRGFLQKTILPLRRRRQEIAGGIRLSITHRIAVNYLKLLFVNGILFFLIFPFLYVNAQQSYYTDLSDRIVKNLEESKENFGVEVNPYTAQGVNMILYEADDNREVYNDLNYKITNYGGILKSYHINNSDPDHRFVLDKESKFKIADIEYRAIFYYNMTSDISRMGPFMINLIFLYLVITFCIIKEGKKNNVKLLEPIQSMSATVNRLTVNNLHSERLNVEGTKNELKDLAAVFNNMLDRIETSYESQKQFVSNASHELRTPIAVIQGYVNMLDRWGSKDQAILEESIDAIKNEAKSMQDLVEKLLFLSRHDKKTLKLEKGLFNMKPVVEEMLKETKLVAINRNIECPFLEDVNVYGDKQALKQAIRVFIDNAVKYTVDGDTIRIYCKNIRGDCVIGVEDTGIGMTRKDMDNIFERFYRSDHVRDRKIDGHGLGLSIAKLIIMSHTGRIKVRSQYTKGTSFIVTIPRIRINE
ncbi:MAG: HAMP domain-containing sensor histidine kinase [Clostridiales bacterium]|nr:HAMP domain-containing sensor histidine kinase [Clostridiales bacterium]